MTCYCALIDLQQTGSNSVKKNEPEFKCQQHPNPKRGLCHHGVARVREFGGTRWNTHEFVDVAKNVHRTWMKNRDIDKTFLLPNCINTSRIGRIETSVVSVSAEH